MVTFRKLVPPLLLVVGALLVVGSIVTFLATSEICLEVNTGSVRECGWLVGPLFSRNPGSEVLFPLVFIAGVISTIVGLAGRERS